MKGMRAIPLVVAGSARSRWCCWEPSPSSASGGPGSDQSRSSSERRVILDRAGRVLAEDGVGARIFVDGGQVRDLESTAQRLCEALGGCDEQTRYRLVDPTSNSPRFRVARRLATDGEVAAVLVLDLSGVHVQSLATRRTPTVTWARSSLATSGRTTAGCPGSSTRSTTRLRPRYFHAREDVALSIDIDLEAHLEQHVEKVAAATSAIAVTAVVLAPTTGDVLAAPQWPAPRRIPWSLTGEGQMRPRFATDVSRWDRWRRLCWQRRPVTNMRSVTGISVVWPGCLRGWERVSYAPRVPSGGDGR